MEEEGLTKRASWKYFHTGNAPPQMLLATISIGKPREAEPAGKFLEDISEGGFSLGIAGLGGCAKQQGLSRFQGPH